MSWGCSHTESSFVRSWQAGFAKHGNTYTGVHHRVIILYRGSMPRKRTGRKRCNSSRLMAHWLMALVGEGGGWGGSMYSAFHWNCSVSYLSFVYGRSLWAELKGGENSLHWKANMLPLFSIMTLWSPHTESRSWSRQDEQEHVPAPALNVCTPIKFAADMYSIA